MLKGPLEPAGAGLRKHYENCIEYRRRVPDSGGRGLVLTRDQCAAWELHDRRCEVGRHRRSLRGGRHRVLDRGEAAARIGSRKCKRFLTVAPQKAFALVRARAVSPADARSCSENPQAEDELCGFGGHAYSAHGGLALRRRSKTLEMSRTSGRGVPGQLRSALFI